jgi:hypothetical protein
MKDKLGREYKVGDTVIRAYDLGHLSFEKVTRIENGKMYIEGSKVAINFPERMIIWDNPDPIVQ